MMLSYHRIMGEIEALPTSPHTRLACGCRWVLSERALSQVAAYKYIAGPSTPLDRLMNHWWNYSVHGLPMWVAPNLVTLLGLLCMVAAAVVVVIQSPNCTDALSPWVRGPHRCDHCSVLVT